jgi:phage antirepressor YoqD-like protein
MEEKALLNIKEFCEYLGIGETKARELLKQPRNGYAIKIGAKWYVHKNRLDVWLLNQCDKY